MATIRRIDEADWTALRDLRLRALQDAPRAFGSTHEREAAFDEATWRQRAGSRNTFFAEVDGVAVGLAAGFHDPHYCQPSERLLVAMWVDPAARGQGVAAGLVEAVADWARDDGASTLVLEVASGNDPAQRVYERAGFVATGHAQPMERDPSIIETQFARPL